MSCPMRKWLDLTDNEVERFCNLGCSVICEELLEEYLRKRDKRRKVESVQLELPTS